ncbi:MAG: hypothetical protein ACFBZ9_16145 [Sphingomonadales bacterium]
MAPGRALWTCTAAPLCGGGLIAAIDHGDARHLEFAAAAKQTPLEASHVPRLETVMPALQAPALERPKAAPEPTAIAPTIQAPSAVSRPSETARKSPGLKVKLRPRLALLPRQVKHPLYESWDPPPERPKPPAQKPPPPAPRQAQDAAVAQRYEPAAAIQTINQLNDAAYNALSRGDRRLAMALFEQSLQHVADQPLIHGQVGYLHKEDGNFPAARAAFLASAAYSGVERVQPGIAREIAALSRPLRLSGYTVWREGSRRVSDVAFGPSLAQSQSGLASTYRLPFEGWSSRHNMSVYSRFLWAYEPESLSPDWSTAQGGIGVQLQPFKSLNLITAAERLISIGSQTRDDWLLRTSWSAGGGYIPPVGSSKWLHWSAYADVALIDPADPDIQLLGDVRIGLGWRPFDARHFALIPFAGLSASYEDAAGRNTDLYEAAAGIWLRLWPGDEDLTDPARVIDARLEYRAKLGGDSVSSSGVRLTMGVNY